MLVVTERFRVLRDKFKGRYVYDFEGKLDAAETEEQLEECKRYVWRRCKSGKTNGLKEKMTSNTCHDQGISGSSSVCHETREMWISSVLFHSFGSFIGSSVFLVISYRKSLPVEHPLFPCRANQANMMENIQK